MTAADRDPLVLNACRHCGRPLTYDADINAYEDAEGQYCPKSSNLCHSPAARAPQPAPTPGVGDEGMRERVERVVRQMEREDKGAYGKSRDVESWRRTLVNYAARLRAALDPPDTDQGTP